MKHYGDKDGLLVLSRNAVFTAVLSNRTYGKTWTFKRRAFRRAVKHGKKTIWLRLFKKEAKECVATFYSSKDLQKYCGIDPFDKDTNPNGNFKQIGNAFYVKRGKRWVWFLKIYALTDCGALRSVDDVDIDTIVFDEFTKPTAMYRRYHGSIATDFLDIFFSLKREHKVRCVFLGNKESFANPIFDYFHIKPLPATFEGIRSYCGRSFAVQQINNKTKEEESYDAAVKTLLKGTSYGNYIYANEYRASTPFKKRCTPSNSAVYCQVYIKSHSLKISVLNGFFYVNGNIENGKPIYCDLPPHKWNDERILVKKHKAFFSALVSAIADNRVYYDDASIHEAMQAFTQWLGV